MEKLTLVFAALLVATVYAAPDNFLGSLKSLHHFKRAEALMKPLQSLTEQKKDLDEMKMAMLVLDQDHDNMLNKEELKVLFSIGGAPANKLDEFVDIIMMFDVDKNGKLDINELEVVSELGNLNDY